MLLHFLQLIFCLSGSFCYDSQELQSIRKRIVKRKVHMQSLEIFNLMKTCIFLVGKSKKLIKIVDWRIEYTSKSLPALETKLSLKENLIFCLADKKQQLKHGISLSGVKNYNGDMFQIIGRARFLFHLAVLESIFINMKSRYCLVDRRLVTFSISKQPDWATSTAMCSQAMLGIKWERCN